MPIPNLGDTTLAECVEAVRVKHWHEPNAFAASKTNHWQDLADHQTRVAGELLYALARLWLKFVPDEDTLALNQEVRHLLREYQ